jgi:hypothetical protein
MTNRGWGAIRGSGGWLRSSGCRGGDEEEGDAEDDEGDEAVGALLAPDVEDDDFCDANEEEAEAGEAEAAFADHEGEEECGDGFDAPADGDAAGRPGFGFGTWVLDFSSALFFSSNFEL